MQNTTFDTIYKDVPLAQKEQLLQFRSTRPNKHLNVAGIDWDYISSGQGAETLLLLPGGSRFADTSFQFILEFEHEYRIISPSYPSVSTMAPLIEGIAAILETENVQVAHVIGASFGGWVAQCFVRRYPAKVETLILNDTGVPRRGRAMAGKISLPLLSILPSRLVLSILKREFIGLISAPEDERAFWTAFLNEVISRNTKEDILRLWECAIDLHQNYRFTPGDLALWPGRVLILESDDDPAISAPVREALKALYPHALVYTFHKAGHTPSLSKREEYRSVVKNFLSGKVPGNIV